MLYDYPQKEDVKPVFTEVIAKAEKLPKPKQMNKRMLDIKIPTAMDADILQGSLFAP